MTGESWIVERGDYAVLIALALGGYLAAASILWQWRPSGLAGHVARLVVAAGVIIAALSLALSPITLVIGIAAAALCWGIDTARRPGEQAAVAHVAAMALMAVAVGVTADASVESWVTYWRDDPVLTAKIGVYIAAYALVTVPAAHLIGHGIRTLGLQPSKPLAAEGETAATGQTDSDNGLGRIIGIMERAILLTLGLLGQWQAIGLVVAAKSIARYKNLDRQDFAEYYLIGTLASLLTALLIGAGARLIT